MKHIRFKYFILSQTFLLALVSLASAFPFSRAEALTAGGTLRVMSYNIHHCDPPYNTGEATDIDTIIGVIAKQNPDIVALQEVDMYTTRSGSNVHQAKVIADRLGMFYFFAPAINYQGGKYGVAILSKYPMSENTLLELPRPDVTGEKRVIARSKITLPGGVAIRFGCTHFDLKTDNKKAQVDKVNELASAETLPFIIAGDLNSTESSAVINTLDNTFTRTCHGCAPTSPARNPNNTIDYIAYYDPGKTLTVLSHKTVNETYASDHRPIVAEITYQNTEPNSVDPPVSNTLKVTGRMIVSEQPTSVSVYNLLGVLLLQKQYITNFEIPLSIDKGIYVIRSPYGSQKILLE